MGKKIKRYKVGIDSETYAISMVDSPAIESDFVALKKEDEQRVYLESDVKHMVYGAALIPDKDIYRNNGEQEFYISFTKESIEKMSQDFMKEYRQHNVTLDHETDASDITVVESWLKADSLYDKSVAIGLDKDLPVGTWIVGMKVNQIDVWDRIKSGELKGFSVESLISLEEFNKQNENTMIETNENFWTKLKSILSEVFNTKKEEVTEEIETMESELEEQTPNEPGNASSLPSNPLEKAISEPLEEPTIEEPITEPTVEEKPSEEPIEVDEGVQEGEGTIVQKEEIGQEEFIPNTPNPLEELIKNLNDELKALKESNASLQEKISGLEKQPSVNPIKPNAKPNQGDTYTAWREQMRQML